MDIHLMLYLTGNMQAGIDDRESKRLHEWIGECPRCGCLSSAVVSDGMMDDGEIIVERVCPACWYAWTTAVCVDAADSAWDERYDEADAEFWGGGNYRERGVVPEGADLCPQCGSYATNRYDRISFIPAVWACECCDCNGQFEIVIE